MGKWSEWNVLNTACIIQHSPSSWGESKFWSEMLHLCEGICNHITCRAINEADAAIFDNVTNEMKSYVDVLGVRVELVVLCEFDRRLVITKRMVGSRLSSNNWKISDRSHKASFTVWVIATYSASVVDRAIISCHLALQETAPPWIKKAYPEIVCLSSAILPSASVYPVSFIFVSPKDNQSSLVPFK